MYLQPGHTTLSLGCVTTNKERNGFTTISAMHETHVPDQSALACKAELQRVLACEDHNHKLQLSLELHTMEPCCSTSKSRQHHSNLQLQLQISYSLRWTKRYGDVMGSEVLQRFLIRSRSSWECSIRDFVP